MALTPFRWVALAAIGCMLAILAIVSIVPTSRVPSWYAPPRRVVDTAEERLKDAASRLTQAGQNLAFRYQMMSMADSVRRIAARSRDTGAIRVFISDGFSPQERAAIDKTVRDARSIRRGDAGHVDLFVINDSGQHVTAVRYQLPTKAGEPCRAYVTTGHGNNLTFAFNSEKSSEQILGPCGFFAAFGEPGPLVRQWLIDGGWQYAIDGSWTSPPYIPELREDRGIFKGPAAASTSLNPESGGIDCIKGVIDACERSMTTRVRRRPSQVPGITPSFWMGRRRYFAGTAGYQADEILSDAVRELGRERFQAFWSSPDSVSVGFQKATGERWGAFIRRWMITHYGEIHPGSRVPTDAIVTSTILVIAAIAFTMLMSVRRTYV
jgi:hypothetical protein